MLTVFLSAVAAVAAPFAEVGRAAALIRESEGVGYRVDSPWAARFGWGFAQIDALVEAQVFARAQSDSSGSIASFEKQATVWARKIFAISYAVKPFVALGAGMRQESLNTVYFGKEAAMSGKPVWLAAASFGAYWPFSISEFNGWGAELEIRLATSPGYAPNPQLGATGFLAYRF